MQYGKPQASSWQQTVTPNASNAVMVSRYSRALVFNAIVGYALFARVSRPTRLARFHALHLRTNALFSTRGRICSNILRKWLSSALFGGTALIKSTSKSEKLVQSLQYCMLNIVCGKQYYYGQITSSNLWQDLFFTNKEGILGIGCRSSDGKWLWMHSLFCFFSNTCKFLWKIIHNYKLRLRR